MSRNTEVGITDFPHLDALEQRLERIFEECNVYGMEIGEIIIFGSYGAGVATKGVSDLDVFLYIEPETLGGRGDLHGVAWCMENWDNEHRILDGYYDWFSGLDVDFSTNEYSQWKVLYRMAEQGEMAVYSLSEREHLGEEELKRRKEIADVRGRLDLMDERDVEGPQRERLERKLERLNNEP